MTLNYGSILQMFCVGISGDEPNNYTMEIPLLILPGLNADEHQRPPSLKKLAQKHSVKSWKALKLKCLYKNYIGA